MPEIPKLPIPVRTQLGLQAVPVGWPPDVNPNQLIASGQINAIRSSVYAWPGDVDAQNHHLRNVILDNPQGVLSDPTTTKGDLIARGAAALTRLAVGVNGQVLVADSTQPLGMKWFTPAPAGVATVFGRSGAVVAQPGDYSANQVTNAVDVTQGYSNPNWIVSLAWGKITGAPATYAPSAHTHVAADVISGVFATARLGAGVADNTVFLRGDGTWASATVAAGAVPSSRLVAAGYGMTGGGDLSVDRTLAVLDDSSIQRVRISKAGGVVGVRRELNLIEGSNVSIAVADDIPNNRVNVTIASTGSGGSGGAVASVFGRTGAVLAQAGDYTVSQITGALADPTAAQGDLIVRDVSVLNRLAAGAAGQVLTADPAQSLKLKWAAPAVASVFGRTGVVVAAAGDYTVAQITNAVPDARKVIAGAGMTGGGTLVADVTLNANVTSVFGRTGAVVLTPADLAGAGGVPTSRLVTAGAGLSGGGDLSADRTFAVLADSTVQQIRVSKAGALVATRREVNFVDGTNATVTVADDAANNRVNVTVASTGSGGAQTPWTSNIDAANFNLTRVGLLGIGTTSPQRPLEVLAPGGSASWAARFGNSAANIDVGAMVDGGNVAINASSWGLSLQTGGTTRLGITSAGKIGIGITTPSVLLEVADATSPHIKLRTMTGSSADIAEIQFATYIAADGTEVRAKQRFMTVPGGVGQISWWTGGGGSCIERMRLTDAGNVGIGKTNPAWALDVVGSINCTGNFLINGTVHLTGAQRLWDGGEQPNGTVAFTVNEAANQLNIRVVYSNGVTKNAVVALN
jgi:hypothetical protein